MDMIKALVLFVTLIVLIGCEWVVYEGDEVTYLRTPVVPDWELSPIAGPVCYNADQEWWDDPVVPYSVECTWECARIGSKITAYIAQFDLDIDRRWVVREYEFPSRCEIR